MSDKKKGHDFSDLVCAIRKTHEQCSAQAGQAINISLTLRNWMIGRHISEFELKGADRAVYGKRLLRALSVELRKFGVSGCGARQLYGYLAFYRTYPGTARSVTANFKKRLPKKTHNDMVDQKVRSVTAKLRAGMKSRLFVSKYQLELPRKEDIEQFLEEQIKEVF